MREELQQIEAGEGRERGESRNLAGKSNLEGIPKY